MAKKIELSDNIKVKEQKTSKCDIEAGEVVPPTTAVQEQVIIKHTVLFYDPNVAPMKYNGPILHSVEELKEQARLRGIKVD
ncbi:MAG: hypothetical protein RSB59_04705 [Clostridia bacterium]